jgi:Fe2+ transport system protein FeoA
MPFAIPGREEPCAPMHLTDAKPGARLALRSLPANPATEHQMRSLGLLPGAAFRLVRRAPFRGPLLVEVGGRVIALSWKIACGLDVSPAPDPGPEGA